MSKCSVYDASNAVFDMVLTTQSKGNTSKSHAASHETKHGK